MGREAQVHAEVGREAGEVRALLESDALILRGDIRRRFPRAAIEGVTTKEGTLSFTCAGEAVCLHLGVRAAVAWATAITTPPPSLRAKLGLAGGARALLVGACDDEILAEALEGVLVEGEQPAAMLIARIDGPKDLEALRAAHSVHPALPIWAIYPKGKAATFGDAEIRMALRGKGFRDTKSCAVSDRLTATRYHPA